MIKYTSHNYIGTLEVGDKVNIIAEETFMWTTNLGGPRPIKRGENFYGTIESAGRNFFLVTVLGLMKFTLETTFHKDNAFSILSKIDTFTIGPGSTSVKNNSENGMNCSRCGMKNDYAESNQPDGSYLCYNCRS